MQAAVKKKRICVGLLAHVDAGKTTLSEAMLYLSGRLRSLGRVDKGSTFLDTYELERQRGITIFSKQAVFSLGDTEITLMDTPGHADFSAEMERTLHVLDYAVLVINGADGVQGHTRTLWRLLERYQVPVFLFVNKMDQDGTDREHLLAELKEKLSDACVDFDDAQDAKTFYENLAVCDEGLLERYLEEETVGRQDIVRLIRERKVYPCYFGSALKLTGVEEFLQGLRRYLEERTYPAAFGAQVYKIARDRQGNRLTYMKITGGALHVRDILRYEGRGAEEKTEEKVSQIRIYSGARFETVPEAEAGRVCAVAGLAKTYAGQGLGIQPPAKIPLLEPVLSYQVQLPGDCDVHRMYEQLRQLEEEEPELQISRDGHSGEIHAKLMGEVQTEVLKSLIKERFGVPVTFGEGSIVYKETIARPVEGVGHFEPLRHYAEVHLLLEPLEAGSGLVFDTLCSEDVLDRNWQRLILTHLEEKEHIGVLTGSVITDMKITLLTGKAHLKHTEGGDFRQATYRAVRQGLMCAKNILLEPYYEFRLELPDAYVGRAMADIRRMGGTFDPLQNGGEMSSAVLTGSAPVSAMQGYQTEVVSYTRGTGRLSCVLKGYFPCHNAEEVTAGIGYDAEQDPENPSGSVFCAHGAGFVVPWDLVPAYMHLDAAKIPGEDEEEDAPVPGYVPAVPVYEEDSADAQPDSAVYKKRRAEYEKGEKELEEIFERTYGTPKRERYRESKKTVRASEWKPAPPRKKRPGSDREILIVDGYNIIFSWEDLNALSKVDIAAARERLKDILCNYQGYQKCTLVLVFDSYKVKGHQEEITTYHNIHVVYTKEAETADSFIEKTVHAIGKKYQVTVATSDGLEQVTVLGQGAMRLSARELQQEVFRVNAAIEEQYGGTPAGGRSYLGEYLPEEVKEKKKEEPTQTREGSKASRER